MLEKDIIGTLARLLNVKPMHIEGAIALLDSDCTIPFIARYRKEATGEMKDEQLRELSEKLTYFRNLIKRQEEIKHSIEEQGKLTEELSAAIDGVIKLQDLEDLYLPYKQKKRTRAMIAKERGLEPLAQLILAQKENLDLAVEGANYLSEKVPTVEDALNGASDIIAEDVSDRAEFRSMLRKQLWHSAKLVVTRIPEEDLEEIFLMYEEYEEPIKNLPSHRILAINRGEKKGALKVKLVSDVEADVALINKEIILDNSPYQELLVKAIADGYKRLIQPALERELRNQLTETAEEQAIELFGKNLKQLLLQPPLAGYVVMGIDPGYRTGCKVAIVDATGQLLEHGVIHVTLNSDKGKEQGEKAVLNWIKKYGVTLISIGNGTASYETECFVAELINKHNLKVKYIITNEAGASVYSASKLAIEELPDYDVTVRGAVSIARRVQDPLAELVKIDPKAIGVGQYQHDVNQKSLAGILDAVVETAVNHVGVELNTASGALLKHVSGINGTVAKNIIKYRDENGEFKVRKDLLKVSRLGPATFEQCAGFLRINGGKNPLDNTPVHPESYQVAEAILNKYGFSLTDLEDKSKLAQLQNRLAKEDLPSLANELAVGLPTVKDIVEALGKPGRDPREDLPVPLTRQNIVKLEDIQVGTIMTGVIRNITDFGAFVDIGLKTFGLIHITELAYKYVKHPLDVVAVGDVLKVMVISVEPKRQRIGLSLKQVSEE